MDANKLEHVQSFRARTMREALRAVRSSLGDDALILDTRGDDRQGVEVLAGREAMEQATTSVVAENEQSDSSFGDPYEDAIDDTNRLRVDDRRTPPSTTRPTERTDPPTATANASSVEPEPQAKERENEARPSTRHPVDHDVDETPLADRLASIESALHSLTRGRHGNGMAIDRLCSRGVPLGLARQIVEKAVGHNLQLPPTRQALLRAVSARIHCEHVPTVRAGQQRKIAFVGPTGVGKTTTLAKIAAGYRLNDKLLVGLITVDDYRVAAADQLQTYAGLLECPVRVVASDDEMRAAVDDLADCDVILVDTAGFGLADGERMEVLSRRLDLAGVTERYLVLSTVSSLASMRVSAERYAKLGPTAAIYTKLDETPEPGVMLGMSDEVALPLYYVTAGQEVPRDLDLADSVTLAETVLGKAA